jgi:hypothetical protein
MADETPRVVLFGNTAPISSIREVQALDDSPLECHQVEQEDGSLRWTCDELEDPGHPLSALTVDQEKGLVGTHVRERITTHGQNTVSVTEFKPPESMGLIEAVSTALRVYAQDHSDDPPEWVWSTDEGMAAAIADHFSRQGHQCTVGIPEEWERKRSLNTSGLRMILEAQDRLSEVEGTAGGGEGDDEARYWDDGFRYDLDSVIQGFMDPWDRYRTAFLRTDAGKDFQSRVMGDTASTGTGTYAAANWIALTENATAPAAGDTTLATELTTGGLGRAQAAYAHTGGASTYTLIKTFTSSDGSTRTINKIGVFNASSSGSLVFTTAVPSPPALVSGDSLTITETVTI